MSAQRGIIKAINAKFLFIVRSNNRRILNHLYANSRRLSILPHRLLSFRPSLQFSAD